MFNRNICALIGLVLKNVNFRLKMFKNCLSQKTYFKILHLYEPLTGLGCSTSNHDVCNYGGNNQQSCEAASCWWQGKSAVSFQKF